MQNDIQSFSHAKTNQKVFQLITCHDLADAAVIDVGAGEGYFSQMLGDYIQEKYHIAPREVLKACDLFPEQFKCKDIACDPADINGNLFYADNSFDFVCSIEVIEHLEDQFHYLKELYRVTKEGGRAFITTPNILNINSRLKYLYSGFYLLFDPLPLSGKEPVHLSGHIHPVSYYYLIYMLHRAGFKKVKCHFDRTKKSSCCLSLLTYPILFLLNRFYRVRLARKCPELYKQNQEFVSQMNSIQMLTSRTIIIEAIK